MWNPLESLPLSTDSALCSPWGWEQRFPLIPEVGLELGLEQGLELGSSVLTLQSRSHGPGEAEVGVDAGAHSRGVVGAAALVGPQRAAGLAGMEKSGNGIK